MIHASLTLQEIAMKSFMAFCSLCVAAVVATPALAQEPRNDLFTRLDANKDGKLVRDELPENQRPNFGKIDANSDGAISRDELNAYTRRGGEAIKPTHADVAYGPHERNKIDLYLAESKAPTPLVLYIHGGGFRGGDKSSANTGEIRAFQRDVLRTCCRRRGNISTAVGRSSSCATMPGNTTSNPS
jgi:acetyl esterase/lipase